MGKVTVVPHDGRMIMGGKGCITPFSLSRTKPSETKQNEPGSGKPDPMQPAVDSIEEMLKRDFGELYNPKA